MGAQTFARLSLQRYYCGPPVCPIVLKTGHVRMVPQQFVHAPLPGGYSLAMDQSDSFQTIFHSLSYELAHHLIGLAGLEKMEVAFVAEVDVAVRPLVPADIITSCHLPCTAGNSTMTKAKKATLFNMIKALFESHAVRSGILDR